MLDKLKGYLKAGYKLVKNNLNEAVVVAAGGCGGGFLVGDRWAVLAGCAAGLAYVLVAKKLKD